MPYDFEDKNLDFGRTKATKMKGNKRIILPKASSVEMEDTLETRRQEAGKKGKIYDEAMEVLGKPAETKGMDIGQPDL